MTLNMALSSYFNGLGRTRIPMTVGIIGQVVGVVMTVGLVFGRFGLPEMGMRGSALGTLCAVSVMFVGYAVCLPRGYAAGFGRLLRQGAGRVAGVLWLRLRRGAPRAARSAWRSWGRRRSCGWPGSSDPWRSPRTTSPWLLNYAAVIPLIGLGMGCNILCGRAVGAGPGTATSRTSCGSP